MGLNELSVGLFGDELDDPASDCIPRAATHGEERIQAVMSKDVSAG
jgi:hypothetical protein